MIEYNPKNWIRISVALRGSVLPRLTPRILTAAVVGAISAYVHDKTDFKFPVVAHTLIGVALSLLLVFRTNASYDRYWEGRKLLGQMVNRTRDLARQAAMLIEGDDEASRTLRTKVCRLIPMTYALIRQNLRLESDLSQLGIELTSEERKAMEDNVPGRPLLSAAWISDLLIQCVQQRRLTEQRLQLMDANVTALIDAWGGAQRIQNTPVPFAYAQHIKIFVVLFCFTVPLAMVDTLHWYTPLASALLAFALFGIDEIGVEIEEPFGLDANDLPMDRIGQTIARDVAAALATRGRDTSCR